jgi:beta-phosphoglucomutase
MLKAIILDFNGVLLDDEPFHFAAMRESVVGIGIDLGKDVYWARYLPLDDGSCLDAICRDYSVRLDGREKAEVLRSKSEAYQRMLQGGFPLLSGAAEFVRACATRYPLALASGARRTEIETTLESTGLRSYFVIIVAAEDFVRGKPHPESFLLALDRLNRALGSAPIQPRECLVVEDSVGGVEGAIAAGMKCLAVANSYPPESLKAADRIAASLEEVQLETLQALFEEPV